MHIPKNGGTTITTMLKRNSFFGRRVNEADERESGHETIVEFLDLLGDRADEYFKFSFVRNPWDRFVSAYHYVCQRRPEMDIVTSHDTFADFVKEFAASRDRFLGLRYFRPQWAYLIDDRGECPLDFVGRFERFDADVETVLKRLGLRRRLMRHRKPTRRGDYRSYYNDETRDAIADVYARDVTEFGYSFDDGSTRKQGLRIRALHT